MFHGVDWQQLLSWRPGGGDPPDLTGYTGSMDIVAFAGGPVIETLTTGTGEITLGLFTLPATDTEPERQYNISLELDRVRVTAIPHGSYSGTLLIESPLGEQIPPMVFDIKVSRLP